MKYNQRFNQSKAIRFRQFTRKRWALFACVGRVVTIGVLSAATLLSASAATDDATTDVVSADDGTPAADKEVTLSDLEVTGSLAPLALGQAARIVTVLTRDDIQAAPVHSINDLLKYAVGVDVRQRGPLGAQTDIGIRGSTSEQVTILLNGINICDPQTAHHAMDLPVDLSDIERIEILEGPAGRVYGTSSLAGAINVVTVADAKQAADEKSATLRAEGGSFGYLSAAARVAVAGQRVSAGFTRSDGYQRAASGALNSDYAGGKAFYQGRFDSKALQLKWHAGLSLRGFGSNTFYSARFDEQYEHTTKLYTALQGETGGALHVKPAVYWTRAYDRFELIRGSEIKVPFNRHRTDVLGAILNSHFDWVAGRTAVGAEVRYENMVSTNLGEPLDKPHDHYAVGLDRTNISLHLEHNVVLKRFTLSAGFVATKNTWARTTLTVYPGVDASLRIADGWRLYASYNTSLRMPSFTELYYSVGGHKADPHLRPEELRAVEGGLRYDWRGLSLCASVFHHHARNLIDWVMDTRDEDPVWQSVNFTRVNTFGQELTAELPISRQQNHGSSLSVAYCHLHQQKNDTPNLQSRYALEYLRHKVSATYRLQLSEPLSVQLHYRWHDRVGTYTTADGTVSHYHPYSVVDCRLTWSKAGYTAYVTANNLTNHHYVDYGNVPQPGTWVTVGGSWKLHL